MSKVLGSSGENSFNPEEDAKLKEEELPQVFGLILLVYGFAAGFILEGLARGNSTPQGKTGDVEMDVVKDQNRLKAEGNDGVWDTTGLTVHSDLMLRVEFMEMDTNLSYQGFAAMLALIWVHPEWVKRELMLSLEHSTDYQEVVVYNSSGDSVVLIDMVDFQHKEVIASLLQKQENIVMLDFVSSDKSEVDFRSGFTRVDDCEDEFVNPVLAGEETEGSDLDKEFITQVMEELLKMFKRFSLSHEMVEERTGIGDV